VQAQASLNRVVRNAFQEEINKRTVKELLSLKREDLMADVKAEVPVQGAGRQTLGR
jgi:membrane protease subunit HflC